MKKKIIWLILSSLMVLSLMLASCAPAAPPPEKKAPPVTEKPAPPVTEKPAPPPEKKEVAAEADMMKIKLTKQDGTVVEKWVEKPTYGGVFTYCYGIPVMGFDEATTVMWYTLTMHLTNEDLFMGDWAQGPAGTGEATFPGSGFPDMQNVRGFIAESWELRQPDTLVFHIRKGIRWHNKPPVNGRELTADDVVSSIKRIYASPLAYNYSAYPPPAYHPKSVTAPDKYTVAIQCSPGYAGMTLQGVGELMKVVPREVSELKIDLTKWQNSIGTGPFMLVDNVHASSATFVRNPNYWQEDPVHPGYKLPYLDGVKMLIIEDASTRLSAIRTAKLDIYQGLTWEDMQMMKKTNPQLLWTKVLSMSPQLIYMRTDVKPFDDIRVRRALHLALDKKAVANMFYGGYAEIQSFPALAMAEHSDMYTPLEQLPESARELYGYNPDKAKQLLVEAGYPDGFQSEILCYKDQVDWLSIVKDYWAKVGVKLELDVKEHSVWNSMVMRRTHKQMVMRYWSGAATCLKLDVVMPGYPSNLSYVDDKRCQEAGKKLVEYYFDKPKKHQFVKEIIPYIIDQAWWIQWPNAYYFTCWYPWVKGYQGEECMGYMDHMNEPAWLWLDRDLKEKMTGRR